MAVSIALVWHRGCPHVVPTRQHLARALEQLGLANNWREFCVDDPDCPEQFVGHGSPTILVDGEDIAGAPAGCRACRVYTAADGSISGVPPVSMIVQAIRGGNRGHRGN